MGYAFFVLIMLLTLILIPFHGASLKGAAEGLSLFAHNVLPALFPFLCCTNVIVNGSLSEISKRVPRAVKLPFYTIICSLCGTPSAAVLCRELYSNDELDIHRASVTCAALNSANPIFIISVLASGFLKNEGLAAPFAAAHYIPPALFCMTAVFLYKKKTGSRDVVSRRIGSLRLFTSSIESAVTASLRIGGTIVFFSVLYAVLSECFLYTGISLSIFRPIAAFLEMINGLRLYSVDMSRSGLSLCAFILSFGGLCIFIQSKLIFEQLKASPYFLTKLICGSMSFMIMWVIDPLSYEAMSAFSFTGEPLMNAMAPASYTALTILCGMALFLFTFTGSMLASRFVRGKK